MTAVEESSNTATRFSGADDALNYLFGSFANRHSCHTGKHDSEFRQPHILMDLAKRFNALPVPQKTCLVSGSKGKGSVSRMIAWNLSTAGWKVGLVVTPEEVNHLDRIRIDNASIPEPDFCRILSSLRPAFEELQQTLPDDFYFSPTGVFLLIGLLWFQEQGVDGWVIEGGRGVKFDEIGQLDAEVGVVTNILPEHKTRLGPTIERIAADKLTLADRCKHLVVGEAVLRWRTKATGQSRHIQAAIAPPQKTTVVERPRWLDELNAIAHAATLRLSPGLSWRCFDTPAFYFAQGGIRNGKIMRETVCCDAVIHPDCLDTDFLRETGLFTGAVLIGLSQDKDGDGIVAKLKTAGFQHFYTIGLSSRVGHLSSWDTSGELMNRIAEIEVVNRDDNHLGAMVKHLAERHGSVYVIGVQLFIRSMRHIMNVGLMNPRSA